MRAFAVVAMLLLPVVAGAQSGGGIGIYPEPEAINCFDSEPITLFANRAYYVVHLHATEANTSQFMVANNWPEAVVGAVDYGSNLNLGNIYTGVTITYVGCKPLPHLLATLNFIPVAETVPCSASLVVLPDPVVASGNIEVVDCSSNVLFGTGGIIFIGADFDDFGCRCEIATEAQTWGGIKALYQ